MQSSTTWEQNAKALADQMVGKDAQLKDISEYLATQTHECKHAGRFLAASAILNAAFL